MLYTLNLHNVICPLYFNKAGKTLPNYVLLHFKSEGWPNEMLAGPRAQQSQRAECQLWGVMHGFESTSCSGTAIDSKYVSPPKSICWNPNPQCDGVRRWSLWELIKSWGWRLHDGISALIQGTLENPSPLPSHEDTVRRQPSMNKEDGPHQTPNLPAPWPWTSSLQTVSSKYCHLQAALSRISCYSHLNRLQFNPNLQVTDPSVPQLLFLTSWQMHLPHKLWGLNREVHPYKC